MSYTLIFTKGKSKQQVTCYHPAEIMVKRMGMKEEGWMLFDIIVGRN